MTRRSALLGAAVAVALLLLPRLNSGPRPSPSTLSALSTAPFADDRDEAARANRGVRSALLPPTTTSTAPAPPPPAPVRRRTPPPAPVRRRTPPPAPRPAAPRPVVVVAGADVWARLRQCESGGNYADNTGNGYFGAYQFSLRTWRSLGYSGLPSEATPGVQDEAAQTLQARSGWGQWPACSRHLGLR